MEDPPFAQGCGRSVYFEMGAIDHDPVRLWTLRGKDVEDPVEHAQRGRADEVVVEPLLWPVGFGGLLALEAISDYVDDTAHHPPVIHTRHTVRQRKTC